MKIHKIRFDRQFFHNLNGKNVKIGIIDTGVDERVVKNIINAYKNGYSDYGDYIGHGTKVAQIIGKLSPMSLLYNIKIFDDNVNTTSQKLLDGINWAIYQKLDIINLSLGTKDMSYFDDFNCVCKKAIRNNVFIVSSIANDYSLTLPAILDNVIGVASSNHKILDKYGYYFLNNKSIQCIADGGKYFSSDDIETPGLKFLTSYAAPIISSIIALLLEYNKSISYKELLNLLSYCSLKDSPHNINYIFENLHSDFSLKKIRTNLLENKYIKNAKEVFYFPLLSEHYYFREYADLLKANVGGLNSFIINDENSNKKKFYEEMQPEGVQLEQNTLKNCDLFVIGNSVLSLNDNSIARLKQLLKEAIDSDKLVYSLINQNQINSIISDEKLINYKNLIFSNHFFNSFKNKNFHRSLKTDIPTLVLLDLSTTGIGYLDIQLQLRRQFIKKNLSILQISTVKFAELFGFDFILNMDLLSNDFPFTMVNTLINYINYELMSSINADLIFYAYDSSPYYQYNDLLDIRKCNNGLFIDSCLRMTQPDAFFLLVDQFTDLLILQQNIESIFIQHNPDFIVILLNVDFPTFNQNLQKKIELNQRNVFFEKINSLIKNIPKIVLLIDFSNHSWADKIYDIIINYYNRSSK